MICGKKLLALSLLFLLLSVPFSWADYSLSEAEMQELETIFVNLGTRLDEQAATIATLETSLATALDLQGKLQLETETQKLTLTALKKSYDAQGRKAIVWGIVASLISASVGLIAGLLL